METLHKKVLALLYTESQFDAVRELNIKTLYRNSNRETQVVVDLILKELTGEALCTMLNYSLEEMESFKARLVPNEVE